jgi:thioredoxin 1
LTEAASHPGVDEPDPELEAIRARLRSELEGRGPGAQGPGPEALDHPVDVTDADFAGFVQRHDLVVVDCWAPWCGPCRIVGPIVDQLAREMAGKVVFGKLNTDENPAVAQAFGIMSIPTMLVFSRGRLVDRIVGALPKPQLAAFVQRHVRGRGSPGPRRVEG